MELGSEFNLKIESLKEENNSIYDLLKDYSTLYLDTGRSGLHLICETFQGGEVLLPEYICDSILKCFTGMEMKFYRLESNLEIDVNDLTNAYYPYFS